MASIKSEDLLNHDLKKPIIRTMENDLRSLKSDLSPKDVLKNLPKAPGNLPVDSSRVVPPSQSYSRPPEKPSRLNQDLRQSKAGFNKSVSGEGQFYAKTKSSAAQGEFESVPGRPGASAPPVSSQPPVVPAGVSSAAEKPSVKPADKKPDKAQVFEKETFSSPRAAIPPCPPAPVSMAPLAEPSLKTEKESASPRRSYATPSGAENLPPEARLAMQSSLFNFEIEKPPLKSDSLQGAALARSQSYKFLGQEKSESVFRPGSIIKYASVIVLLAVVSYGVYFFGVLRDPFNPPETEGKSFIAEAKEVQITTDLSPALAEEIKRYFSLSGESAPGAAKPDEEKTGALKPAGVYRLIIKSRDGAMLLKAEDFKKYLNMDIPPAIIGAADKNYNLIAFYFPQKRYARLALVFRINDSDSLPRQLAEWESSMASGLEPLFLGSLVFEDPAVKFRSNAYGGADIRYLPLGLENTALNYSIDENKKFLLFATSKDDIFYLIDKIGR